MPKKVASVISQGQILVEKYAQQNILRFLADRTCPLREPPSITEGKPVGELLGVAHIDLYSRRMRDIEQWSGFAERLEWQTQVTRAEHASIGKARLCCMYQAPRPALIAGDVLTRVWEQVS